MIQAPEALRWDHNAHYHRWVLGQVPTGTVRALDAGCGDGALVTAVSSLHHMPLRPAAERLAGLVRPGGRLLVVGLYESRGTDLLIDLAALPAGLMVGAYLAARGRGGKPHDVLMPVRDPVDTLADVRRVAADLLPGATIKRRLFFRFTLSWTKP